MTTLRAAYDLSVDVLYVTLEPPHAAYSDEGEDGLYYEYDDRTQQPCAVTVDGFREVWGGREGDLSLRVAKFLGVEDLAVRTAVRTATAAVAEPSLVTSVQSGGR